MNPPAHRDASTRRRSMLGLLGVIPAAIAVGTAARSEEPAAAAPVGRVPRDLLPGGRFDRFVAERAAADEFSGSLLVAHRGRPVLVRSYGMAVEKAGVPNRRNTSFDLASVTKTFTATAIGQLVRQGLVAFHEPIGTHLSGFPDVIAENVTVQHLLTHTSGLGRPPVGSERPPGWETWDSVEEFWAGMSTYIRGLPPRFAPGTRYGYSNDGFFVLGEIVAAASGRAYYDYVRREVFEPAGMTSTHFHTRPQVLADPRIARPYMSRPGGGRVDAIEAGQVDFVGSPYRGAYSTVDDMLAFARALGSGELLRSAYVDLLTTGKVALGPRDRPGGDGSPKGSEFYGFGFRDAIVDDYRVFGHSGSGPGAANRLDIFPDPGWVIVVLGNFDNSIQPIVDLARELIAGTADHG